MHDICIKQLQSREDNAITKCVDAMNQKHFAFTCKLFNTVYSLARSSRPFFDMKGAIELQLKSGVDLGVGLHSRYTAVKIVDHVGNEIKNNIFTKIIKRNRKVCIIVDEVSSISNKPVLIIFLKIEDCDHSPTIFLD